MGACHRLVGHLQVASPAIATMDTPAANVSRQYLLKRPVDNVTVATTSSEPTDGTLRLRLCRAGSCRLCYDQPNSFAEIPDWFVTAGMRSPTRRASRAPLPEPSSLYALRGWPNKRQTTREPSYWSVRTVRLAAIGVCVLMMPSSKRIACCVCVPDEVVVGGRSVSF